MNRRFHKTRAAGQASVPGLLCLSVCVVALALMVNSAQLTQANSKLQDTADAVAYSVAVLQARDFNYTAYTNRAMVANQVAVAQIVSLKSWLGELQQSYAPSAVFDALAAKATLGDEQWATPKSKGFRLADKARAIVDRSASSWVTDLDAITVALSDAQRLYHDASIAGTPGLARAVARSNDGATDIAAGWFEEAGAGGQRLVEWGRFSVENDPAKGAKDRLADIVTDSETLDDFVIRRGERFGGGARLIGVRSSATHGSVCANGRVNLYIDHAGGTVLVSDAAQGALRTRWEAIDAADAHGEYLCHAPFASQRWDRGIARDGAVTAATSAYTGVCGYGNYCGYGGLLDAGSQAGLAGRAEHLAGPGGAPLDRRAKRADGRSSSGLQPYRDLAALGAGNGDAPVITVEVERANGTVATLDVMGKDTADSRSMRVQASGRAHFIRPVGGGSMKGGLRGGVGWTPSERGEYYWEYPSLFSPYWQASLAAAPGKR
ncbi:hypothetical protein [Trinickia mobilis]|uniref:hypothetical protein n=1 Tax=Trinickia mobilis TaxID=2816356 RepID=UPI001A90823A|nr:hypothetical protein [Trinickia mobilis]